MQVNVAKTMLGDYCYVTEFMIGNPPQKLRGVFDTGSTEVFIMNKDAKLFESGGAPIPIPTNVNFFDNKASSSYKGTN